MSTHTRTTTEPNPTTETQTDATPTPTSPPAGDDTAQQHDDTAASWVAQCQSQFDAGHSDRLRNLTDDENHAMPDGV
ncbi:MULTISPECIES: hypothetical protein [Halobacterium]|uniref:hypothetical protein n=1 Tax=Halobacterium TaxID=2239 RepID=UPI00073EBE25|nr:MULTISPECIES: hypothetical protein [Halobacterium]MCG1003896.1 hypothetical protein [Halobacterium noricense]